MTIPEASGSWFEKRVQEELEAKGDNGVSFCAIGRQIAKKIESRFEVSVNPITVFQRAKRQNGSDTNVSGKKNPRLTLPEGGNKAIHTFSPQHRSGIHK